MLRHPILPQDLVISEWQVPSAFSASGPADSEKTLPLRLLDDFKFYTGEPGSELYQPLESLLNGKFQLVLAAPWLAELVRRRRLTSLPKANPWGQKRA